jgi:glycosyltransferase involved in cell wall biosynthesis
MRTLIHRSATAGFAASSEAGRALFDASWGQDARWGLLRCGINLDPFKRLGDRHLRQELGIPDDAFVIGHVGRFVEAKNHAFLVSIARAAGGMDSQAHFLLVGDGPLRPQIELEAARQGVRNRITFAGERHDVPQLMTGVMDAFVLPSITEGLPVALLEAQAAGLRALVSDRVSPEAEAVLGAVCAVSLAEPAGVWAERLLALKHRPNVLLRENALRLLKGSPFDIRASLDTLSDRYFVLAGMPRV